MRRVRWYDLITVNIYWLGISMISGSMTPLILPYLVQQFVADEVKNTFYGNLRFAGLMIAVLVQPAAGLLSDRCTSRWGKRRPFILIGTLFDLILITVIGLATGYWALFAATLALQVASNIAHGAQQGLIPDLIPEDKRGRASGVKAIMELLPVVIVAFTVSKLVGADRLWAALAFVMGVLAVTALITLLAVREEPLQGKGTTPFWKPFLRVFALTLAFTAIIQGARFFSAGVNKAVGGSETAFPSISVLLLTAGGAGLIAVLGAVFLGVWASIWLGVGSDIRRYPSFAWWVVNRLLFLAAVGSLQSFAFYFLQDVLHLENPASATGNLMAVVGVLTLVSALPSGALADRFGPKRLLILAGLGATVGTVLLVLSPNLIMVYVAGSFIGLAAGVFMTTNWTLGTQLVPREESGRFLGMSNLAGAGAGAIGAGIGGPLADFFNAQQPGLGYLVIFAIFAMCFILSAVVLFCVRGEERAAQAQVPQA